MNVKDSIQPPIWTTKDGRKIKIYDMGDSHLLNAIKMVGRKAERMRAANEERFWMFEQDSPESIMCYLPVIYYDLIIEAENRGLDLFEIDGT